MGCSYCLYCSINHAQYFYTWYKATLKMLDPKLYAFCKKILIQFNKYLKFTSCIAQFSTYYTICTLQRLIRYSPCLQRILGPQREPKNIFRKSLYWYMYKIISNLIFWDIEKSILETMNTEMGSEEWIVFLPVAKSSMVAFSGRRLLWEEA